MTNDFLSNAEIFAPKFERLAARKCVSSAKKAAEAMSFKTTAGIMLAILDGCFVWVKFSGKKVSKFLPVFPETSVKNPNKNAKTFANEVGEYFLYQNKLFYYDGTKKTIAHMAILYSSDIAKEKVRLKNELFVPRNWKLAKASTNGKTFYAWLIYDGYGRAEFFPVFDQDYSKMLDKDGKELPKKEFSIKFLNMGQSVIRKGKLYPVSYGAARTSLQCAT